ncbi:hypothetical protein ACLOJK_003350, partial [Asimina triloba]
ALAFVAPHDMLLFIRLFHQSIAALARVENGLLEIELAHLQPPLFWKSVDG